MEVEISTDRANTSDPDISFLSLSEVCGLIALFLSGLVWALLAFRFQNVRNFLHTLLYFVWMTTNLTLLKYGRLFYNQVKSKHSITVDVPWFTAKQTPLISAHFLSVGEKIVLWIAALISPFLTGIFASLLWANHHYPKARQANLIALVCLIAWTVSDFLSLLHLAR